MEAIILAGGMGTRLQSVVSDVPKCMAPVAGKPFLSYLFATLENAGFNHIILSLGYKHEVILKWLPTYKTGMDIDFVIEDTPLGTGGAVKFALSKARQENTFILNGDTFFHIDYASMLKQHRATGAEATLALKEMRDFARYGTILTENNTITAFREKQYRAKGLINAGTYLIRRDALAACPDKFSLEKDYFETNVPLGNIAGFPSGGYFIDIGIPEDYAKAQTDFLHETYKTI